MLSRQQDPRGCDSPAEHHDEVHDVPAVPQVGPLVEHEAQRQQLDARLEAEDPDEVGLRLLLVDWNAPPPPSRWLMVNATTAVIITSTHPINYIHIVIILIIMLIIIIIIIN